MLSPYILEISQGKVPNEEYNHYHKPKLNQRYVLTKQGWITTNDIPKESFDQGHKLTWSVKKLFSRYRISGEHTTSTDRFFGESDNFMGTFRYAIRPFLVIGQIFGVMPVIGVTNRSLSKLHFKWNSIRTCYGFIITIYVLSYTLVQFWTILTSTVKLEKIVDIVYYSVNSFQLLSFFCLASKWPKLMQNWQIVESNISSICNKAQRKAYIRYIRSTILIVFLFALIEHLIADASVIILVLTDKKYKEKDPLTELAKSNVPYLITTQEPIPTWLALIIDVINLNAAFVWSYTDLFIMVISIGLSTHFKLLNNALEHAVVENRCDHEFFVNIRIQYAKLCSLVETVDNKIGHIILMSFFNNLLFICKQLYESLRPSSLTFYRQLYFWYSLIFLIVRTISVSLLSSYVNDESRRALKILYDVKSSSWNAEAKRFFDDIVGNTVALTGMDFFYLTRKLILSVAGTIVTYELVLLQLN